MAFHAPKARKATPNECYWYGRCCHCGLVIPNQTSGLLQHQAHDANRTASVERHADIYRGLDWFLSIEASYHAMKSWMLAKVRMRSFSLILLFALCQIVGIMCTLPDLSLADDAARLAGEMSHMACPMNGTNMCPLSAVSSPERQLRHAAAVELDQAPLLPSAVTVLTTAPFPTPWSWESVFSIVPISIASSSVLRI